MPVVHFSVVWWSTLHQQATVLGRPTDVPPIDPRMGVALGLSVVAVTAAGLAAVVVRLGAHADESGSAQGVAVARHRLTASAPPTDPPLDPTGPDPTVPGRPGVPQPPGPDEPPRPGPDEVPPVGPPPDLPDPSVPEPGPATQPAPAGPPGQGSRVAP